MTVAATGGTSFASAYTCLKFSDTVRIPLCWISTESLELPQTPKIGTSATRFFFKRACASFSAVRTLLTCSLARIANSGLVSSKSSSASIKTRARMQILFTIYLFIFKYCKCTFKYYVKYIAVNQLGRHTLEPHKSLHVCTLVNYNFKLFTEWHTKFHTQSKRSMENVYSTKNLHAELHFDFFGREEIIWCWMALDFFCINCSWITNDASESKLFLLFGFAGVRAELEQ